MTAAQATKAMSTDCYPQAWFTANYMQDDMLLTGAHVSTLVDILPGRAQQGSDLPQQRHSRGILSPATGAALQVAFDSGGQTLPGPAPGQGHPISAANIQKYLAAGLIARLDGESRARDHFTLVGLAQLHALQQFLH